MKICPNCGAQLDDSAVFCTTCGAKLAQPQPQAPIAAAPAPNYNQQAYAPAPAPAFAPYDHTAEYDPKDISDNKVYAMLPYILSFIGVIVALLAAQDSPYTKFHVRQGLKILVTEILVTIIGAIIPILGWIALAICVVILFIVQIICFVRVCKGQAKEPPIVRVFGFMK